MHLRPLIQNKYFKIVRETSAAEKESAAAVQGATGSTEAAEGVTVSSPMKSQENAEEVKAPVRIPVSPARSDNMVMAPRISDVKITAKPIIEIEKKNSVEKTPEKRRSRQKRTPPPARAPGLVQSSPSGKERGHTAGKEILGMLQSKKKTYTREEMLQIGEEVLSKLKPTGLEWLVDRDNHDSPLLDKVKFPDDSERRKTRHDSVAVAKEPVDRDDVMGILTAAEKERQVKEKLAQRGPKGTKVDIGRLFDIANQHGGMEGVVPSLPPGGIPAPPQAPVTPDQGHSSRLSTQISLHEMIGNSEPPKNVGQLTPEQQAKYVQQQAKFVQQQAQAVAAQQQAMMHQMMFAQQAAMHRQTAHAQAAQAMAMHQYAAIQQQQLHAMYGAESGSPPNGNPNVPPQPQQFWP